MTKKIDWEKVVMSLNQTVSQHIQAEVKMREREDKVICRIIASICACFSKAIHDGLKQPKEDDHETI